ncbi:MAG: FRG domain-containing protein [Gemmatimonadota bacterium]|nr:FRG domain-containing protein [Gemmatimonadota bacterium]
MRIAEHTVGSLGELLDLVTPSAPDPRSGRHRDAAVYRGSGCVDWPLLTSLDRLGGTHPPHTKAHLEAHVLRSFVRYSRPHLHGNAANDWELLVLAQHHGAPTRLLDWSWSPLVAAHFATLAARGDEPCAVWRLDWHRMHRRFGIQEIALLVSDLERLPPGRTGDGVPFTPAVLMESGGRIPPFACLIEPPALDARIVSQAATFTVCTETTRSFDEFLMGEELGDTLTRYVIEPDAVPRVRDQLDLAGMDERRLFPDFDGVAAYIRRWYA